MLRTMMSRGRKRMMLRRMMLRRGWQMMILRMLMCRRRRTDPKTVPHGL